MKREIKANCMLIEIRARGSCIRLHREGLDGVSANSQRHQNSKLSILSSSHQRHHNCASPDQRHQNYPLAISVEHLQVGADGVAGKMIIIQYENLLFMLPLPHTVRILLPTKKKYIYISEEKGKVIRRILSHTLLFFSSTVSPKTERLNKKSEWLT